VPENIDQPYQSLYRRFRPQRFAEVRGQDHVTRPLLNAVRAGQVAHAYLFSGPRGTGKTSTARLLAMALNCANPQDGEPCGECESCIEIRRGSSVGVHELDAASNRKLDEMRDLLSRVALGTPGRWKVYIIDEVHQLTPDAASALLKTLEEPPGHVVFVLCTTDPQKVLPTIRSRTQHFEFRLLPPEVLGGLVRDVVDEAGLGVTSEAVDLVVRRGQGSARDALSVLDQVAAAGQVEEDTAVVAEAVDGVADRDAARVLGAVAEAITAGRDPRRLAAEILEHLRNGFLALTAPDLVLVPDQAAGAIEAQARRLGLPAVVRALEVLGEALAEMRDSVDPRITLEVALVRLARPEADHSPAALLERIERLERAATPSPASDAAASSAPPAAPVAAARSADAPGTTSGARAAGAAPRAPDPRPAPAAPAVESGRKPPAPSGGRPALGAHRRAGQAPQREASPQTQAPPRLSSESSRASTATATLALPSRDQLTKAWGDHVLAALSGKAKSRLSGGRFAAVEDGVALFALPDQNWLGRCEEVRPEAEAALAAHFGRAVPIRLVLDEGQVQASPTTIPADDPEIFDISELEDAPPGLTSPEQRLLEAFPGAEEVSP
jgi:DNA polymerase III subunit gamma/tau